MADERDRERGDGRPLRVLRGGRDRADEVTGRDREPGREAAGRDERDPQRDAGRDAAGVGPAGTGTEADRIDREAREQLQREDLRVDDRPGAPLTTEDRQALRDEAADLRSRAGGEWSRGRTDDDQAREYRNLADDPMNPDAPADDKRADWLAADADREQRNARVDEAAADSAAAQAETADHRPQPQAVQEPTRNRLSPTDGTQAPYPKATVPASAPVARHSRSGGRSAGRPRNRPGPHEKD